MHLGNRPAVTCYTWSAAVEKERSDFRESLKDLAVIAQKLMPFCATIEEMLSIIQLAIENDGQLRLLMNLVTKK